MSEFRKVISKPGEIIDFETVFEENPYLRTGVPTKKGTVERVDYQTERPTISIAMYICRTDMIRKTRQRNTMFCISSTVTHVSLPFSQ